MCVAMEPTHFGCSDANQEEACVQWLGTLLAKGRALSAVVVNEQDEPVAFGLTLFISDEFRQFLLSEHNQQLIGQRLRQFCTPRTILALLGIERGHRGEGLNMVGFYGWREELPEADLAAVRSLLYASFPYLHAGYHLKSFLKEVYGAQEAAMYTQMGFTVHKQPSDYPLPRRALEPYLMGVVRGEVSFPARAADLFQGTSPPIKLKRRYRELGQLAYMMRLDDEEITQCLGLTDNALYNLWSRLGRRLNGNSEHPNNRFGRRGCLRVIAECPAIIYPLSVHTRFYHCPERARQYPLPLQERALAPPAARRANAHERGMEGVQVVQGA